MCCDSSGPLSEYDICTCGADGNAIIWRYSGTSYEKLTNLPHGDSQIYACEVIQSSNNPNDSPTNLITAADNEVILWNLEHSHVEPQKWVFNAFNHLTECGSDNNGNFGGSRNPDNIAYVFDVKVPIQNSSIISVALSDGTIRICDLRLGQDENILMPTFSLSMGRNGQIPATSVTWNAAGTTLLASTGSGDVDIIDLRSSGDVATRAVLRAHKKACYGASFYDTGNTKCISWSSDQSIKLWNVETAQDICIEPIETKLLKEFPIFSCAVNYENGNIACGGGDGKESFIGTPIHFLSPF